MKDVGGAAETRSHIRMEGRTDRWNNAHMDCKGHFYSPPPPVSGDNQLRAIEE